MARDYRHTIRLSEGEEQVAHEVKEALECKSIPEMFRWLLDHTQMPDSFQTLTPEENKIIEESGLTSRPPIWRYALRVQENVKLRALLDRIKDAIRSRNSTG